MSRRSYDSFGNVSHKTSNKFKYSCEDICEEKERVLWKPHSRDERSYDCAEDEVDVKHRKEREERGLKIYTNSFQNVSNTNLVSERILEENIKVLGKQHSERAN